MENLENGLSAFIEIAGEEVEVTGDFTRIPIESVTKQLVNRVLTLYNALGQISRTLDKSRDADSNVLTTTDIRERSYDIVGRLVGFMNLSHRLGEERTEIFDYITDENGEKVDLELDELTESQLVELFTTRQVTVNGINYQAKFTTKVDKLDVTTLTIRVHTEFNDVGLEMTVEDQTRNESSEAITTNLIFNREFYKDGREKGFVNASAQTGKVTGEKQATKEAAEEKRDYTLNELLLNMVFTTLAKISPNLVTFTAQSFAKFALNFIEDYKNERLMEQRRNAQNSIERQLNRRIEINILPNLNYIKTLVGFYTRLQDAEYSTIKSDAETLLSKIAELEALVAEGEYPEASLVGEINSYFYRLKNSLQNKDRDTSDLSRVMNSVVGDLYSVLRWRQMIPQLENMSSEEIVSVLKNLQNEFALSSYDAIAAEFYSEYDFSPPSYLLSQSASGDSREILQVLLGIVGNFHPFRGLSRGELDQIKEDNPWFDYSLRSEGIGRWRFESNFGAGSATSPSVLQSTSASVEKRSPMTLAIKSIRSSGFKSVVLANSSSTFPRTSGVTCLG